MDPQRAVAYFSATYAEARRKFIEAATRRELPVESEVLDLPGAQGETLAIDVVRDGPRHASRLLVILSGVHGLEGFCGSAIQTGLLVQGVRPQAPDTAVLYVHAVNPYGFSHLRRATQENVDLNRNFVDFGRPLPVNAGYAEIHDALLPQQWPPGADAEAVLTTYGERHGARGLQQAISLGQHTHPDGLHYGGAGPTWSNQAFRAILRRHAAGVRQLASIDIHTGLGPSGHGERIFASFDPDPAVLQLATRWWGQVTDVLKGTSASIPVTGPIQAALHQECPGARHVGICLEFGTHAMPRVMNALRAEHSLHRHGAAPDVAAALRAEVKEAFYPDSEAWKIAVWRQGREACMQALDGLEETVLLPLPA